MPLPLDFPHDSSISLDSSLPSDTKDSSLPSDTLDMPPNPINLDVPPPSDSPPAPPLPPTHPHLTITIPPLHHSAQLTAQSLPPPDDPSHTLHAAFLTSYSPVCNTHDLLPADVPLEGFLSISEVLTTLSDGTLHLSSPKDDNPSWAAALASLEHEYIGENLP